MTNKEFKHIAPILASLRTKKTGFKVPDSYFDTLESTIVSKLHETPLPEKRAYILPESYLMQKEKTFISKLEKESFIEQKQKLPTDYFDTFEDRVIERLAKEKKKKTFSIKKYWIPAAIAASIVLVFTIYNPFTISKNKEIEEITNWIEDGNLDLDSYQIAEFYNSDLESFEIQNTIGTETLENYIINEFTEDAFYN